MSPTTTSTRHTVIESPVGPLTVVRNDDGLVGLYFPRHWTRPDQSTFGPLVEAESDDVFREAARQLDGYFAGNRRKFELPLAPNGDEASLQVWRLLDEIPYGSTETYGELAGKVGGLTARDVGAIVGRNPLAIFVACHRVVGKNGKLTGYAGGLPRKQFLLNLEQDVPDGPA
jgi:methylated-DNA-[protein]-cysteine S-methyltransferase